MVHERDRPGRAELLVGIGDVHDVAGERDSAALEREHRHQVHDPFALHVQRATPVDESVLDRAAVGVDGPVSRVRGDDVNVMHERDRFLGASSPQARVQVRAPGTERGRRGVEDLDLEPLTLEDRLEKERALDLVARRVGRVELHVVREHAHGLVAQLVPVDRTHGVRRGAGLCEHATRRGDSDEQRGEHASEAIHVSGCRGVCRRRPGAGAGNRRAGAARRKAMSARPAETATRSLA